MKTRLRLLQLVPVLQLTLLVPPLPAGEYFLEANASDLPRITSRYGLKVSRTIGSRPVYLVTSDGSYPAAQLLLDVRRESGVAEFEPDSESRVEESRPSRSYYPLTTADVQALAQNRTLGVFFGAQVRSIYPDQTASTLIHRAEAQQQFPTGAATIAIIDTGIDPTHPAFKGALVPGYDFTRDLPGFASDWGDLSAAAAAILGQSTVALLDHKTSASILNQSTVAILDQSTVAILDAANLPAAFGHGTMVAGLVHLVAPSARLMPLKAFRADGSAKTSDIVRAIYYAVDNGAKVINMSFSMDNAQPDVMRAIDYANSKKVICVASAGNQGRQIIVYPAGFRNVIGVGSTDRNDRRCSFSNYGESCARTAAPGEMLVTLYPGNNYAAVWGTSFSAGLVSGAVAVMQSVKGDLQTGKVLDALDKGKKISSGMEAARLDLLNSLKYLNGGTGSH